MRASRNAPFADNIAIITGGASGIGRALVQALAARGCFAVIFDIDTEGAQAVVAELAGRGLKAQAMTVDVRDRKAVADSIQRVVSERGRLDLLFNNAGIAVFAEVRDYDWPAWEDVINTNLLGVIHGIAAAYPIMIRQGSGHIINISSLAGLVPTPWAVSYTAAKCGVWGLSVALRVEAAVHGVKVSCVCPPAVSTPIIERTRYINLDKDRAYVVVPGRRMTSEACALSILRGVERNRALIKPGVARWMSLFYRLAPGIVELFMRKIGRKLSGIRADSLKRPGKSGGG